MICRFSIDAARHELTPVDNTFIAEYLPFATGLQVQVYLYGLMQCCYPAMAGSIADVLGVSDAAVLEAFCYWQAQGLVRVSSEKPLTVEYLSQHASAPDTAPRKYAELVSSVNALTAPRQFGMREWKHVYDWIEVFGLEEGAVLELVAYCLERKGRRVSINYMSTVAQSWSEDGVRTRADARVAIEAFSLETSGATAVLRQWNKRRRPTVDEMALYSKWTGEWGFTDEAILAALPRLTVSGSPNFTYLDELLSTLRDQNLTAPTAIMDDDEKTAAERAFAKLLFERAGKVEVATKTQRAQISMYLADYNMPRELLLYAAELSRGSNEPFGRMKLLLNEWHEKGVASVAAAEAYQAERAENGKAKPNYKKSASAPYEQHKIKDEDFKDLLLDLNEDL